MSARGFGSVLMVGAIAGTALSCYLVSLRVASERAALETVENRIALAQRLKLAGPIQQLGGLRHRQRRVVCPIAAAGTMRPIRLLIVRAVD